MQRFVGKSGRLRFAVGDLSDGYLSSEIWTIWQSKSDLYLSSSNVKGLTKISLHQSNICRYAITDNLASHNPKSQSRDRVIVRWERKTPPDFGHSHIFSMFILSILGWAPKTSITDKPLVILPKAIQGYSVEVACYASLSNPLEWNGSRFPSKNIMGVFELENGQFIAFRRRVIDFPTQDAQMTINRHLGATPDFMFVGEENPENTPPFGRYSTFLAESYGGFARFLSIHDFPMGVIGLKPNWSTREGHKWNTDGE